MEVTVTFKSGECWRSEEEAEHHSGHNSIPLPYLVITKTPQMY